MDLHHHCAEGKPTDATITVEETCKRVFELGEKKVFGTDHGTFVPVQPYIETATKYGLDYVPGLEAYVDMGNGDKAHLLFIAKDYQGFMAISKLVSDSAFNVVNGYPLVTKAMIERRFGPGSKGQGHVFCLSACVQGFCAWPLLANMHLDKEIKKIEKKQKSGGIPNFDEYKRLSKLIKSIDEETVILREKRDAIPSIKKWKSKLESARKKEDAELIAQAEAFRDEQIANQKLLEETKETLKSKQAELRDIKSEFEPFKKDVERWNRYQIQIDEIKSREKPRKEMIIEAAENVDYLHNIFGNDFFIELQYHGLESEAEIMPLLARIAARKKLPIVATNDSHMAYPEDAEKRAIYFSQYQHYPYKEPEDSDRELYMKSEDEIREALLKILPESVVNKAISNIKYIADNCHVEFTYGKHYPIFDCPEGADAHLRNLCEAGKAKIAEWTPEYEERLQYELGVIETMGFTNYFCIINDMLTYAGYVGKIDLSNPDFTANPYDMDNVRKLAEGQVGEGRGPGRGSGAGSLVCYLTNITNIDPIPNNLLFERFLNPERVSMPDIDSDIAPKVRPWVIGYIKSKYGEKAVCQILTLGYFGAKSSIQAAARVLGKKNGDEGAYTGLALDMSKGIEDITAKLADVEPMLLEKFGENADAVEIIRMAHLLEGLPQNYGTHAAGIIISDTGDISDHVPLINVSGAIDCAADLHYVEQPLGLLKLDLLGLRNLGIITECEKAIEKNTGIKISMDEIPDEPEVYKEIFAKGLTNGVFQFESDGMKKTLMNFGPESMSDLTLLNAVFRPGPLQYIDDITAVKKGKKKAEYIIPEMAEILDETYGKPVFQEQIMAIFNRFAGFSLGKADVIRRLMSKKKFEEFASYKDEFVEGLVAHGAKKDDAEKFWIELLDFSAYAFNKSHSRAYFQVAYATAWLKYHYPAAFMAGLLNYTANDKREAVLTEVKNMGITITVPKINIAETDFSLKGDTIVYGLSYVTQVAASADEIVKERETNGKFSSFMDFVKRVNVKKNVMENLIKGGAFDEFYKNREALIMAYASKSKALENLQKKEEKMAAGGLSDKMTEKLIREIAAEKAILDEPYSTNFENEFEKLVNERDVLGSFISGHPVPKKVKAAKIKTILENEDTDAKKLIVFVSDVIEKKSKTTGKTFAVINFEDNTGYLEGVVFADTYTNMHDTIKKDSVLEITGNLKINGENKSFIVKTVKPYILNDYRVEIKVSSRKAWQEEIDGDFKHICPYFLTDGPQLVVFFEDEKVFETTEYRVNPDIKTAKFKI